MDLQLKDKVAIVTGASRGIGLAVAQRLAAEARRSSPRRARGRRASTRSGRP
jgi:NAD(P)-dependent dehydrogenase (short-subunit alcohol dehydrogenase family)